MRGGRACRARVYASVASGDGNLRGRRRLRSLSELEGFLKGEEGEFSIEVMKSEVTEAGVLGSSKLSVSGERRVSDGVAA